MLSRWGGLLSLIIVLLGCLSARSVMDVEYVPTNDPEALRGMPAPEREFRGVWVATVANIDWPSKPGLSTGAQQAELLAILDRAAALHFNAVVLQVRPAADALYASNLEPWSEFLTGEQGRPPEPFYDPLAFAVEEAHKRGLELHAWFNPYRARHPSAKSKPAPNHVSHTQPDAVKRYGRYLWLDPGDRDAERHSLDVILDVVRRYDIDGVHLDDYFYPYKEKNAVGRLLDFPDDASWQRALQDGETRTRDDWRRANVDRFIERLYHEVKREKPWVKVGVSPFGIWRPGHPKSVRGLDAYAELYADSRKWLHEGWVDYFSPQLYWKIDAPAQSYPALLAWWEAQNLQGRHLWPGNYTSRIGGDQGWPPGEIIRQIEVTREQAGATGNVHFSMKSLMENRRRVGEALVENVYMRPVLVPSSPWLAAAPPEVPELRVETTSGESTLVITPAPGSAARHWVVRTRRGDVWTMDLLPSAQRSYALHGSDLPGVIAVTTVDRLGQESPPAVLSLTDSAVSGEQSAQPDRPGRKIGW